MSDSSLHPEATQDELLISIYNHALAACARRARTEDLADVAGDVVADCTEQVRSGTWKGPNNLKAFVRKLVKDKIADRRRKQLMDDEHDAQFLSDITASDPEWMAPAREWDEHEIGALQDDLLARLPARCRMAYIMVRVEGDSYTNAARRLGVTRNTIRNFIVRAQRQFRGEFERLGITSQSDPSVSKPAVWHRRPDTGHFAPRYPERRPPSVSEVPADGRRSPQHEGGEPETVGSRPVQQEPRPVQ
jgi:RNA polymerase sigma-70 factor (ECF subfamily)